jgi:hypothetical protein
MKKWILIFTIILNTATVFSQTTKKVCFLGNSYTYVNDLPSLIDSLANNAGNDIIKDQNTPGGYSLDAHSTNGTSLSKIASDDWDYVVLQDQSQLPSFPYSQVSVSVYPKAEILSDSIRAANECAVPLFYNTWGRLVGDPQWDSINTFSKMNNRLYYAYDYMAEFNRGKVSPVGIGFRHIHDDASATVSHASLYSGDGSHPSIYGSYLAACVFYNVIFEETSLGNSYIPNGVTLNEANYLQTVANHVVFDVDSLVLEYTKPLAAYTSSQVESTVSFTNSSMYASSYYWDFGDGNTSTDENPSHTYSTTGIYTVVLTAMYCGEEDQVSSDLNMNNLGIHILDSKMFNMYPNPSCGQVKIEMNNNYNAIEIFNIQGQLIDSYIPNNNIMTINLKSGIYYIKVGTSVQKLIVSE